MVHVYFLNVAGQNEIQSQKFESQFPLSPNPNFS